MTKYTVTIQIEVDHDEIVGGQTLAHPSQWDWNALLSSGGFAVSAYATMAYQACCESFIEWVNEDADGRYPEKFLPYHHDRGCPRFVPIATEGD